MMLTYIYYERVIIITYCRANRTYYYIDVLKPGLFLCDVGTKRIEHRYYLTGEVSIPVSYLKGVEYRYVSPNVQRVQTYCTEWVIICNINPCNPLICARGILWNDRKRRVVFNLLYSLVYIVFCISSQKQTKQHDCLISQLGAGIASSNANTAGACLDKQIVSSCMSRDTAAPPVFSNRYMSQEKYAEARDLMYNGALLFFSYNQVHITHLNTNQGCLKKKKCPKCHVYLCVFTVKFCIIYNIRCGCKPNIKKWNAACSNTTFVWRPLCATVHRKLILTKHYKSNGM